MDLDKTFSAISDYYRFLLTLWGAYVGICTLALGWLMTLRNGGHMLGWGPLFILIVAFVVVSVIFYHVLAEYQNFLKKLLRLGDALARDQIEPPNGKPSPTPAVAGALRELFDQQPGVRALDKSLGFVWWTVGIVIAIALALKLF